MKQLILDWRAVLNKLESRMPIFATVKIHNVCYDRIFTKEKESMDKLECQLMVVV